METMTRTAFPVALLAVLLASVSARITNGFSDFSNTLNETVIGYGNPRPNSSHQLPFAHHIADIVG